MYYHLIVNNVLTWGIIVILDLNVCNPRVEMSIPSMTIFPSVASIILNNARDKLLFPAPVLPQIPNFSSQLISKSITVNLKLIYLTSYEK